MYARKYRTLRESGIAVSRRAGMVSSTLERRETRAGSEPSAAGLDADQWKKYPRDRSVGPAVTRETTLALGPSRVAVLGVERSIKVGGGAARDSGVKRSLPTSRAGLPASTATGWRSETRRDAVVEEKVYEIPHAEAETKYDSVVDMRAVIEDATCFESSA